MVGAHRLLAESVDEAVFITELDGRMLYANAALQRLTGHGLAHLHLRQGDSPLLHREDAARVVRFIGEFLESGAEVSPPIEKRFVDRWGQSQWYRSVVGRVRFDDREALQFVTRPLDGADAKAPTVDLLREYRILVQNAGDGITKLDAGGRFLFFNDRFCEIVARDPIELGKTRIADLVHPDRRGEAEQFLVPGQFDIELVNGAGEVVRVEVVVSPLTPDTGVMALVRDVTEQRRLERELHNREKLHGLSLLAGGVAHDLNNFLAVVRTNSTLAEAAEVTGRPVTPFLHEIRDACGKAAALCARLLAVSGNAPVQRARVELGAMVEEIVALIRRNTPASISLLWQTERPVFVSGDVTSLQPLVMNLVRNASDAIGARPGHIQIEIGIAEQTAETLARLEPRGQLAPGPSGYIRVRDDGVGMDASTRARMFDPFFTTKPSGHGLGLSSVLGTVRSHGGAIGVESAVGAGTTIAVYLPLAAPERSSQIPVTAGASAVVLVVDDAPALRRSICLMLASAGFDTLEASDGHEAVELVKRRENIGVVLLDASMPVMGGIEAAREIRCVRPGLPMVMMSGHPQEPLVGIEMVTKPFDPDALVELLRSVIAES